MSFLIARVAADKTLYSFDRLFDYIIPDYLKNDAVPGKRVMIPFGSGNKKRQAMIIDVFESDKAEKLKEISAVLDSEPLLTKELLKLVLSMKDRYYCTYYDAVRTTLPAGLNYKISLAYKINKDLKDIQLNNEQKAVLSAFPKKGEIKQEQLFKKLDIDCESREIIELISMGCIRREETAFRKTGDAFEKMIRLCPDCNTDNLTARRKEVTDLLKNVGAVSVKEVMYYTGVTHSVIDALVKTGVCEYFDKEVFRLPENKYSSDNKEIVLTEDQENAYREMLERYRQSDPCVSLLYGVTGAGKTSVFLKLIETVVNDGKSVIVMVPEIALTPQMVSLFKSKFGSDVAVFHSALSMGERLDEWKRVRKGNAKIAVGTRSAVFAPFENIGLIIMDEEQEYTYKSESSPRYHARETAKLRCVEHKCMLLLSSATPSVESRFNAERGTYYLSRLTKRYGKAVLPEVTVVDMNAEGIDALTTGIGKTLASAVERNLENGEQSILLLNRRGYNTFVSCKTCGGVVTCPNCSISLTYHSANNRLMCHYCGFSMSITDKCLSCGSGTLKFSGSGTQKAEQTLQVLFPRARILRLDADSTLAKQAYEEKLSAFKNGEYDILLGTQMVAKGLDFPKVTLVGVLSADQTMYGRDFRAYERAFSLITQVVGRSGRGERPGRAIIQTFTPENPVIALASAQDYEGFYKSEIPLRRVMEYPPFADICMIGIVSTKENKCKEASSEFAEMLCARINEQCSDLPIRVMGPSPASVYKVNNKYRYKIIIKFHNCKPFRTMLSGVLADFAKDRKYSEVTVYADTDPDNIL